MFGVLDKITELLIMPLEARLPTNIIGVSVQRSLMLMLVLRMSAAVNMPFSMNVPVFAVLVLMGVCTAEFSELFVTVQNLISSLTVVTLVASMTMDYRRWCLLFLFVIIIIFIGV